MTTAQIFTEEDDGLIPKVISNPPVEVGGRWVLPYWRQNPRGVSVCQPDMHQGDFSGVLVSVDRGASWKPHGRIMHQGAPPEVDRLIEGAVVPLGRCGVPEKRRFLFDALRREKHGEKGSLCVCVWMCMRERQGKTQHRVDTCVEVCGCHERQLQGREHGAYIHITSTNYRTTGASVYRPAELLRG